MEHVIEESVDKWSREFLAKFIHENILRKYVNKRQRRGEILIYLIWQSNEYRCALSLSLFMPTILRLLEALSSSMIWSILCPKDIFVGFCFLFTRRFDQNPIRGHLQSNCLLKSNFNVEILLPRFEKNLNGNIVYHLSSFLSAWWLIWILFLIE